MWLYLLLITKMSFGTCDKGMDKWFRDNNHIFRDVNQVTKIVEINIKGLADPGFSKVSETMDLHQENAGETPGKPRGLGRQNVGAILPQDEL